MERVQLGDTGLSVSPVGLGCGGYSRLGMRDSGDAGHAEGIVRHALELGVNFFDTARAYGTEEAVGKGVSGQRDKVVLSTKTMFRTKDDFMAPEALVESLEKSLVRLQTDYVDVFSLHGVTLEHLDGCIERFAPALQRQVELGKIRHLGITESFMQDPTHEMLVRAIPTGVFDVVMVGFNFLNSGARKNVFPAAIEEGVGTQVMHAVRRALGNEEVLLETIQKLVETGEVEAGLGDDPLAFIKSHPEVKGIVDAAYRYCRYEPGVSVVLTGTGSKDHLTSNVEAILAPPLPSDVTARINEMFGRVHSVSGD